MEIWACSTRMTVSWIGQITKSRYLYPKLSWYYFFTIQHRNFCIQCAQVVVQNCPFSSSGGWLVLLIPRKFRGFSRLQWWSGFWSAEILVQTRPCTRPSPSWAEEYLTWFFATGRCTPRIGVNQLERKRYQHWKASSIWGTLEWFEILMKVFE